jgi:hypothetical protein
VPLKQNALLARVDLWVVLALILRIHVARTGPANLQDVLATGVPVILLLMEQLLAMDVLAIVVRHAASIMFAKLPRSALLKPPLHAALHSAVLLTLPSMDVLQTSTAA